MVDYSYKNIEGVLDYGRVLQEKRMKLLWVSVFIPLLIPLATLGTAITVWSGEMSWDADIIGGLIGANVVGLWVLGCFIYILVSNILLRKNVSKWLDGAVEVQAFIQRPDLYGKSNVPNQLEVTFKCNGKQIRILSTANTLKRWRNKMFLKYANSSVKVLYAPKYNCVLFTLMQQSNESYHLL